jgi:hypothetical protein
MTITDYDNMSVSEKKKEDWMNSKWRPAMGWMYMVVCFFDFVGAPILWSLLQAVFHGGVNVQWQPLTLQGAGLFHVAMGAVLGLAAWGRTQEKMAGATTASTTVVLPTPAPAPAPAPSFTPAPAPAFGTKPTGPASAAQPEL